MRLIRLSSQVLGLLEDQLTEVVVGCTGETLAEILGVFFGKLVAMEGLKKIQMQVLFYDRKLVAMEGLKKIQMQVLFYDMKKGGSGSILSRHTIHVRSLAFYRPRPKQEKFRRLDQRLLLFQSCLSCLQVTRVALLCSIPTDPGAVLAI